MNGGLSLMFSANLLHQFDCLFVVVFGYARLFHWSPESEIKMRNAASKVKHSRIYLQLYVEKKWH